MSQQINLLARERHPMGSALAALTVVSLVLIGLLGYSLVLRGENDRLQLSVDGGQRQLVQGYAALQSLRQRGDAKDDAAALKTEVDALKLKAEAAKQWEAQTRSGLGSPDGYARHLTVLASAVEDGVWLTSVSVSNGGTLVSLSGRAMRNDLVLRYAKRVNTAFAPQGVQFNSVELTPENLMQTGALGIPLLATVAFRLY